MEPSKAPLADRMRPKRIEEVVGQDHLLGPGSVLVNALLSGHIFSVILWGPPGSGKTSLAKLMAQYTQNPFHAFSAVTSGVKELRQVISGAEKVFQLSGRPTIISIKSVLNSLTFWTPLWFTNRAITDLLSIAFCARTA